MSETITLEQLQTAQNNFINQRTAEINQLSANTAAVIANLNLLANRVYGYTHESFAVKDIVSYYNELIEDDATLENLSAVGFTAVLHSGETVSKQDNRMFINGIEKFADYTFTPSEDDDDALEYVTVWYFSDNGALNFAENNLSMLQVCVYDNEADSSELAVSPNNLLFIKELICWNYAPPLSYRAEKVISEKNYADVFAPYNLQGGTKKFTSSAKYINNNTARLVNKLTDLKYVDFSMLEGYSTATTGISNLAFIDGVSASTLITAELNFPMLKTMNMLSSGCYLVKYAANFTVPASFESIVGATSNRGFLHTITNRLTLNCIDCESLPTYWYAGVAPAELVIADNWACSADFSVCTPTSWTKTEYISIFTNKLRDMTLTDETRQLKIPTAIYDSLTDEEFEIAEDKGWTIGC